MAHASARIFAILTIFVFTTTLPAFGQSFDNGKTNEKAKVAVERSKDATEVLKQIAALPEGKGIPKEIAEKMNMIGVMPDAFSLSLLFSRGVRGHGVASIKGHSGWSLPSYFFFGQANGFDMSSVGTKHFDLIFVVVNARINKLKKKDKSAKSKDKEDDPVKPEAHLYAFADGALKPLALKTGILDAVLGAQVNIVYDKPLNKAIYTAKGDDILLGNIDASKQLPVEVTGFRDALNEVYSTNK